MKKRNVALLISIAILMLPSCQKETRVAEYDALQSFYDMDSFYQWINSQIDLSQGDTMDSTNKLNMYTIPKLQIENYGLGYITRHPHYFRYSFLPLEVLSSHDRVVDPKAITVVIRTNDSSFVTTMESEGWIVEDGYFYYEDKNIWCINHNGKLITIHFPDTIVLESFNQISEYFVFEEYGSSSENSLVIE